jgi:hypothetical protein
MGHPPEVAPVGVVGAEGKDGVGLGGEAEIGIDDGEGAMFGEEGRMRGDFVKAEEAQWWV